jgi:CRISPR-associated endonuclease/helicase Cas3
LPKYRLNRIEKIKLDSKRKIIVSTQLIEAGVDISVDIVYRDMAPLDCLIQTAGRCNRENKEKKGQVNIILLKDEKYKRPFFFSYNIYDPVLIDATKEVIKKFGKKSVSEKDFVLKSAEEYYKLISERTSKGESRQILEHLKLLDFYKINKFRLIKEKSASINIFVEIDEKAENTIKEIEKIVERSKGYEKRRALTKIKRDINQYMLSIESDKIREEIINSSTIKKIGAFTYIPKEEIEKWYKLDTGFEVS